MISSLLFLSFAFLVGFGLWAHSFPVLANFLSFPYAPRRQSRVVLSGIFRVIELITFQRYIGARNVLEVDHFSDVNHGCGAYGDNRFYEIRRTRCVGNCGKCSIWTVTSPSPYMYATLNKKVCLLSPLNSMSISD